MTKDTIVFDLDDVLVKDAFFGILNSFCKERLKKEITKEELGTNYYYEEVVFKENPELIEEFYNYVLNNNMYDYGVIEEGAIELLQELSKTHNVCIYTSAILEGRALDSGNLFKNKYNFICKMFPFISPSNIIIGRNKSIISAKYIIDDRLDNLCGNSEVKILYSASHNLNISDEELYQKGIFRVSSMDELRKSICFDFSIKEILQIVSKYLDYTGLLKYISSFNLQINVNEKKDEREVLISFEWQIFMQGAGIERLEKFLKGFFGVNVKIKTYL